MDERDYIAMNKSSKPEAQSDSPNNGFQIGGHFSRVHFEYNKEKTNECMEVIIHSDGEFPTEDFDEQIVFHICDFMVSLFLCVMLCKSPSTPYNIDNN